MTSAAVAGYRIGPQQQRRWRWTQEASGTQPWAQYLISIEGPVSRINLRDAVAAVVERHEALRSRLETIPGHDLPIQAVEPAQLEWLPDLLVSREADIQVALSLAAALPHSHLGQPIAQFLSRTDDCGILLLQGSAAFLDAAGCEPLAAALAACYRCGTPAEPPQYADIAAAENDLLETESPSRRYWQRQAAQPLAQLWKPATAHFTPQSFYRSLTSLDPGIGEDVLLAAWTAVLGRLGQDAVPIALSCDPRTRPDLRAAMGPLTRWAPVAMAWDPDCPWSRWLDEVRQAMQDTRLHAAAFSPLAPACESAFAYRPPATPHPAAGSRFRALESAVWEEPCALELTIATTPGGLRARWRWDAERLTHEEVESLADVWETVLNAVAEGCDLPLRRLPFLSQREYHRVVEEHNRTAVPRPNPLCPHELFECQVRQTPNVVAVCFEGTEWTYAELNRRANLLAAWLRCRGAVPERPVAVVLERSLDMVVALLGILKAGTAYLPIEPDSPPRRLAWMIADARPSLILTTRELASKLAASETPVFCVETLPAEGDAGNLGIMVSPHQLAYVMYTSGSTGQPKGVMIPHAGIYNLLRWTQDQYGLATSDAVLLKTSYAFDVSVWEFFWPLMAGARLVVARPGGHRDSSYLVELIQRERITFVQFVPSMLKLFLDHPDVVRCLTLRHVIAIGEALSPDVVARFHQVLPAALHNLYGPTEASVAVSHWTCERPARETVPIGLPIANSGLYVLDRDLQPSLTGEPGELYISGVALARGYLGRPDLTAERFVPNAFSAAHGERLYRTGDLARRLPSGKLEYLGRLDQQIKIRGWRIELAEIEAAVCACEGIREAAVVCRQEPSGEKRLLACVVPAAAPDPDRIRAELARWLPDYMVPSSYVFLERLPLSANGKLDRKALCEMKPSSEARPYETPATPAAELLAGIWEEVLGVDRVGARDSFFELGGHSLLAMQVVWRVRSAFGVELPLSCLFDHPTLQAVAAEIERLGAEDGPTGPPPLEPEPVDGPQRLSFAQRRLWFLYQLEPSSSAYNLSSALRLQGVLDAAALERGIAEIAARHDCLRTRFFMEAGEPMQQVEDIGFRLPLVDLSATADPEELVREIAAADARRPFDLEAGPPFRACLLRLSPHHHVLLWCMHHIASDGWSMRVLVREAAALYKAFRAGEPSPLPPVGIQYASYAAWQRRWLQGGVLDAQISYWRQQLHGAPPVVELPLDRPRLSSASPLAATEEFHVSSSLAEALRRLSRGECATLFMTLLAAFQLLLHRYSGQSDIVVGTPTAGRGHPELEALIGFFINTLALRTRFDRAATFRDLLAQVRQNALAAYARQDVPFERLVEELRPERHLTHTPLYQVVFYLQGAEADSPSFPGLAVQPLKSHNPAAKYDLVLNMTEGRNGLGGALTYNASIFDRSSIQRLLAHFQNLLESVAESPTQSLASVRLLSPDEHAVTLHKRNNTAAGYSSSRTIHSLFQEQAARTPAAAAVISGGRILTYSELDAASNRFARWLIGHGAGPGKLFAICMEHSPELLVAILGVLKSGSAYVPLDPNHPPARRHRIVADSGALFTIESLPDLTAFPDASVDTVADLAYVIYTSGSTGQPKGVAVAHRSLVNYIQWAASKYRSENDISALHSSLAFDLTVTSIFVPLISGDSILITPEIFQDPRITTLKLTPAHLALMDVRPAGIRRLIVGGEALETGLAARIHRLFDGAVEIVNEYGPTEATVGCMYYLFDPQRDTRSLVPIGVPVPNTRLYILDRHLQPVPDNVAGELYIAGDCLARGYWKRPDLTAERFLPDPFTGGRLYKTGDLARWLPNGQMEFIGRRDGQLKLRGFRVEVNEVRAALNQHPEIRDSAVVPAGAGTLAAFYVSRNRIEPSRIRAFLQELLLAETIPAHFVHLKKLPLTLNGKIAYDALPPVQAAAGSARFAPPASPVEELLAEAWAEVLGVEQVGRDDSFFELGGHSLLAMHVVWRVRSLFGVDLPLRNLFDHPTLRGVAEAIERHRGEVDSGPPLVPAPRPGPLPLSYGQQRLWLLYQMDPENPVYNISTALRIDGPLDMRALRESFGELVRRHEILRTRFITAHGVPYQHVDPWTGSFPMPCIDVANANAAEVRRLASAAAQRRFDLETGPLFRASLLRRSATEHVLICGTHHIASDGWSTRVLVRETAALYASFSAGETPSIAPPAIQYGDFAVWQRHWLAAGVMERQLAYWREQLRDAPRLLELPFDHPRPAVQSSHGATEEFTFGPELSDRIRRLGRDEGVTPFMTLLAAFQLLLHRYSGQPDVVVGIPIAGRSHRDLEDAIGLFVNTLVMRARIGRAKTFRDLLAQTRETVLEAFTHQDLPFERLVEELRPERHLAYAPVYQTLFSFHDSRTDAPPMPALRTSGFPVESRTTKSDLGLTLKWSGGRLVGVFEYSTDLFEAETIRWIVEHYRWLLESVVEDPGLALNLCGSMPESEARGRDAEWNPAMPAPDVVCLTQLIEPHCISRPDAIAVEDGERRLTYRELGRVSSQIANALRRRGAGPDRLVAVALPRSLEAIAVIYGVAKSGAAYLPLDPAYPRERLRAILKHARPMAVVTTSEHLSGFDGTPAIAIDREWERLANESAQAPEHGGDGAHLAYVIYTSGSTGKPKGVMVEQRSIAAYIERFRRDHRLRPEDRMLQFSPLTFDISVEEIFGTLAAGAALVLRSPAAALSAVSFLEECREKQVSVVSLPTAFWRQLLHERTIPLWLKLGDLRLVIIGGEAAGEKLHFWRSRLGNRIPLINSYGPTETTVVCLEAALPGPHEDAGQWTPDSIGRPVAGARAYVVDAAGKVAAAGVPGELYVGGIGVARGYCGDPAQTAERFRPDEWSGVPGARLYRTGDRVRRRGEGGVEFVGRIGEQVKIRGFRVEPAEVTAALAACPGVRECLVIASERKGERALAAYVAAEGDIDAGRLRGELRGRLPEYMIPSHFVFLDNMPLTAHGKVDRKRLPKPQVTGSESRIKPRTPLEVRIADVWINVLGVEPIGVRDNFFDVGGTSLLIIRLQHEMQEALSRQVSAVDLFQYPTIETMAAHLGANEQMPPLVRGRRRAPRRRRVLGPWKR